jgi:hypothetical protein
LGALSPAYGADYAAYEEQLAEYGADAIAWGVENSKLLVELAKVAAGRTPEAKEPLINSVDLRHFLQ